MCTTDVHAVVPMRIQGGWNRAAIVAVVAGALPSLPGFLATVNVLQHVPTGAVTLFHFAWFVGFGIAMALYCIVKPSEPPQHLPAASLA